ncbi:MAG: alpha/beta hydrolase [Betaproteobacteria bacterium]
MNLDDPMRRRLLAAGTLPALALAGGCATPAAEAPTPAPRVPVGRVERLPPLPSRHVAPRHVDVWLPRGYDGTRPHAVLYMHDGQMLYDATTTWNQQSWEVAPTVQRLIDAGTLRETIVVGVWNTGPTRFNEYFPQGFVEHVPEGAARQVLMARGFASRPPMADAYLRFLVDELKPAIDARYRTRPGREHTAVAGSSMGGLISLYALCEHPQVFGGAGCLSTHWIGGFERNAEIPAAGRAYLRRRLPAPGGHRIYMDRGTAELDALYDEAQAQVDALMRERGFAPPLFVSRVFEGEGHNERAWARRLETPLRHLLAA